MIRLVARLAFFAAVALAGGAALTRAQQTKPDVLQQPADISLIARVEPTLLLPRLAYLLGDPIYVHLQLKNPARVAVEIPGECLTVKPWTVQSVSNLTLLPPKGKMPKTDLTLLKPLEQRTIGLDLRKLFRALSDAGHYRVFWECSNWRTPIYDFVVAFPYDRQKDRVAVLTTDLGAMELVLMPEHAPEHVRNFAELARAGYYDGVAFNRIVPGVTAETGDVRGDGSGGWVQQMAPEISDEITPGRGLVGAVRRETSMTSASLFFFLLDAQPTYRGKHTFFAYVRKGYEVLDALSALMVMDSSSPDLSRPTSTVRIQKIEFREN